ncbi:hypothetical protein C9374_006361 [Naegleria lovaniensis]|uniref:Uncharacterized protein n=1 Tax=Naegleria lovaniensis TaxID=51637 RepID=A0AA88GMY7_NAELO|nr:uncharacterized protein C9374_006361 [Naegleria lovaniensis]KAG2381372.1 hypothetical protein C9374_006361 [Naegleria lovaniensis]
MHYSYGMYLLISLFKYPYVITLEDDLQPSPDFYLYHKTLYRDVYVNNIFNNKESIFSIGAYTHGPIVDCKFLMARLLNEGTICSLKHMNQLVTELYFPGWGSGIESSIFWEYWSIWKNHPHIIYDGLLAILKRNRFTLIPCSPRIRLLRNMGTNGPANHRWDFYLSLFGRWTNATVERHYEIINSKIQ